MIEPTERRPAGPASVSRLGIGGGSLFSAAGDDGVAAMVDACWNAGLRYFDTAALYAGGTSEIRYGRALAGRPRGDFTLTTKAGRSVVEGEIRVDYSYDGIRRSIEGSLERLQLGTIDIAMLHDIEPKYHGDRFEALFAQAIGEGYRAIDDLRAAGAVRGIGAGVMDWRACLRLAEAAPFDGFMLAGDYTLLHQDSLPLLDHCHRHGIAVLLASPFNTGVLATGAIPGARYMYAAAPPEVLARVAAMEEVCREHDVPLAAVALQFPYYHPAVSSVVIGIQSPQELADNMAHLRRPIPPAVWAALKRGRLIAEAAPVPTA